jgi:gamma-glutamyltranspeptidase/glutathione hydrolase
MLDFKLNPYEAAAYPNFCAINNDPIVESGDSAVSVMVPQLESYGELIQRKDVFSGEANIIRDGSGWAGGADPRREGIALGENDKLHTSVSWTPVAGQ